MFEGTHAGGPLAPELDGPLKRALILAGGGLKVAFQAGVLQVWLDEARDGGKRLEFMHADGASGGVFQLAMWCQGMSGHRIAENWRRTSPIHAGLELNYRGWLRAESLFTMRKFRTRVLHDTWGLDWQRIQASTRSATFNVFDVSGQRLVTLPPAQMNEDLLVAATSLPGWYPPVTVRGRTYIDGVLATDANLEAAIAAGANELWVVWTVSTAGRWRNGPVAEYFQVIVEACANGALHRDLDRIARSNQAHAEGRPAQYPHPVRVVPLIQEVPVHYLFAFTRRSMAAAVDLGVQRARQWCRERGLDVCVESGPATVDERAAGRRGVEFRESMAGPVAFGGSDPLVSAQLGDARGDKMTLRLKVEIDDVDAFLADRQHRSAVSGSVDCEVLGGVLPVQSGSVTLVPGNGTGATTMEYRLDFADRTGRELTLLGTKIVRNDPGLALWRDATTLDVWLFPRQQHLNGSEPAGTPVLSGRLRLSPRSLLHQLRTFHVTASTPLRRVQTVLALGGLFLRRAARGTADPVSEFDQWPDEEQPTGTKVFSHNERIVPAPPERVWNLLVDALGWSEFYANAHFVELVDPQQHQLRRGSVFRWVTFGLPLTSEVDPCKRPLQIGWRWRWRWWDTGWHGYHIWLLEPHERGTRIVTEETNRGVLPSLLYPFIPPLLRLEHNSWLRGLARRASRPPQPAGARGALR
jgi:predicted patatin/cPLA2 family phospholipase